MNIHCYPSYVPAQKDEEVGQIELEKKEYKSGSYG